MKVLAFIKCMFLGLLYAIIAIVSFNLIYPELDFETYKNNLKTTTSVKTEIMKISFDSIVYGDTTKYSYVIEDAGNIYLDEKINVDEESFMTKVIMTDVKLDIAISDKRYIEYTGHPYLCRFFEIPLINYKDDMNKNLNDYSEFIKALYNDAYITRKSIFDLFILIILALSLCLVGTIFSSELTEINSVRKKG